MMEIVYKDESYRIMGACFEVYKEMGCGFLAPVYQECLEIELAIQELPFVCLRQHCSFVYFVYFVVSLHFFGGEP
jgi:GxxExxY protein